MFVQNWQLKAARSILNWTQSDLAERAGLSLSAVADIEADRGKPLARTLKKLAETFEQEGIKFTDTGVDWIRTSTYTITGKDWWLRVVDDVYYTLIDQPNAECIFVGSDDRVSPPEVNNRYRKLRNAGIRFRQFVEQGNTYLLGPVSEYRYLPKERFYNNVTLIYGDKVAACADDNTKAVIFKDKALSKSWRNIVETLWPILEQPESSTADERF